MSAILNSRIARAFTLGAILAVPGVVMAESKPKCETIAKDVKASVTKEPTKVLMIVEDALVINEGCACEIVKTAIAASHADAAMIKQIVQTAVAVAPKMAPIIMECAGTTKPEEAPETVAKATLSGKDAKNVQPVQPEVVPPKDDSSDNEHVVGDIHGIYLMQPAVGGPSVTRTVPPEDNGGGKKHHRPQSPRTPPPPMSPSCSCVN